MYIYIYIYIYIYVRAIVGVPRVSSPKRATHDIALRQNQEWERRWKERSPVAGLRERLP